MAKVSDHEQIRKAYHQGRSDLLGNVESAEIRGFNDGFNACKARIFEFLDRQGPQGLYLTQRIQMFLRGEIKP